MSDLITCLKKNQLSSFTAFKWNRKKFFKTEYSKISKVSMTTTDLEIFMKVWVFYNFYAIKKNFVEHNILFRNWERLKKQWWLC